MPPRSAIEEPARKGYLDRIEGRGYAEEYASAIPAWQRNYESGRLWAAGIIEIGVDIPEWSESIRSVPQAILNALVTVRERIGPSRPEDGSRQPDDPSLAFAVELHGRRRRFG